MSRVIRVGTRGSKLALAQVEIVRNLFAALGVEIEPVVVRTSGDRGDRELLGAFVREIQVALLDGHIDVALHCLKDLPTIQIPGLAVGAYLAREDPRDAIITRHGDWMALPDDAIVGTGSLRRTAQLLALRPGLRFRPLVGNVDTRLAKLVDGEYDAIVLAMAGLQRLGLDRQVPFQALNLEEILPAPGQGVLVLETRENETWRVKALNHGPTEFASRAERAFLGRFGTGCRLPIGAIAAVAADGVVSLSGRVSSPIGTPVLTQQAYGTTLDCERLGRGLADGMIDAGALRLLPRMEP